MALESFIWVTTAAVNMAGVEVSFRGTGSATHLRPSVDKEHCGMLLPWLEVMGFIYHPIKLDIRLGTEMKDLRGDVIGRTAYKR